MEQVDRFPATGFFRGTRTIMLRSLPAGVRLSSFRVRIIPLADQGSIGPALEEITFPNTSAAGTEIGIDPDDSSRETAVSRVQGGGAIPWSEVQLGGFRTLARVEGTNLIGKTLQVDLGGLFMDVGDTGTVPAQGNVFDLDADAADLPGLTVQRLRLTTAAASTQPVITRLFLRAVASNLTLSFARQPAAWALPGDVSTLVETTDLTEFAQAALDEAEVEGGFALLPLNLKTDTTARLAIEVISEVQELASGLPAGLNESTLDYAHNGTSEAGDDLLNISIPPNMEVDPDGTRIAIDGTFEGSEISLGPVIERSPEDALSLDVGMAAAQPVAIEAETVLDAADVLLSTQARRAEVKLDLREDFDGKPGDVSLLSQPATGSFGVSAHGGPRWLSAALGQTVTLPPDIERVWLVVEAVSEPIAWHVNAETGTGAEMQTSDNGGLSWRAARAATLDGPLAAQLRFRRASPVFRVPLAAEIGRGAEANVLSLEQFQPLGRVEFTLDSGQVADAANNILSAREATSCPRGEQLANGGFGDRNVGEIYQPASWSVSGGTVGRQTFPVQAADGGLTVRLVRLGNSEGGPQSISQVFSVSPGCAYGLTFRGFAPQPGPVVELNWRQTGCGLARTDILEPPPFFGSIDGGTDFSTAATALLRAILSRTLNVTAPPEAEQLEVRLLAPAGQRLFVDAVSLFGGPAGLRNPDFTELDAHAEPGKVLAGWTILPSPTADNPLISADLSIDGLRLMNVDAERRTVLLTQSAAVTEATPFAAALEARPNAGQAGFAVRWMTSEGAETGTPLAAAFVDDGTDITRLRGTVPERAATAELQIQLAPGADATLVAAAAEVEAPEKVPVSFLAEAPGRMTIRDFTVAFRPRPQARPPAPPATPCLPTPADAAPADICECDPCCGKDKETTQVRPATVVGMIDLPQSTIFVRPSAQPRLEIATRLPAASATARIMSRAREMSLLRLPNRNLPRALAVAEDVEDMVLDPADTPVRVIKGVGERRQELLAEAGIRTVGELAERSASELVEILDIKLELARNLISQALKIMRTTPG